MGLHSPRGRFERLDTVLAARIWRTPERRDSPVAATCRNIGASGCRFHVEDERLVPGFDLESPIHFSISLEPSRPEIAGAGKVVWLGREWGDEPGTVRAILGVEFTSIAFADQERIKAFIFSQLSP